MVEVTVLLLIFCTPRITMHICLKKATNLTNLLKARWLKTEVYDLWWIEMIKRHLRSFHHNGHSSGVHSFQDSYSYLFSKSLLNLQPSGVDFHYSGKFAQSQHFARWKVSNGNLPVEGHQMMFAHGKHFNVFHHYHFVMILIENCIVQDFLQALIVSFGEIEHGFSGSFGRLQQTLTIGVFTQWAQQGSICAGHFRNQSFPSWKLALRFVISALFGTFDAMAFGERNKFHASCFTSVGSAIGVSIAVSIGDGFHLLHQTRFSWIHGYRFQFAFLSVMVTDFNHNYWFNSTLIDPQLRTTTVIVDMKRTVYQQTTATKDSFILYNLEGVTSGGHCVDQITIERVFLLSRLFLLTLAQCWSLWCCLVLWSIFE